MHTTLTAEQEAIVVQVREIALLSLDDRRIVARESSLNRSSTGRRWTAGRRHGVSNLQALKREQVGERVETGHKPFRGYVPGLFVHLDVKYLP